MNNEKIIETLLERVEILEDEVCELREIVRSINETRDFDEESGYCKRMTKPIVNYNKCEFKAETMKRSQVEVISSYIIQVIDRAKHDGFDNVIIRSGEIHKALNLTQRIPSVCNAMRKIAENRNVIEKVEVLKDTPSHNSSTYTIKYYFKKDN